MRHERGYAVTNHSEAMPHSAMESMVVGKSLKSRGLPYSNDPVFCGMNWSYRLIGTLIRTRPGP